MLPLYTRVLSQSEYGILDIILVFSAVLFILIDLQFIAGFSRFFYEYRNAGQGGRLVGTVITSLFIGGSTVSACFIILGFIGAIEFNFLPSFKNNTTAWILAVINIPLTLIYDILLLQTRMLRWKKLYALGSLSTCVLSGLLSAYFAILWRWGIVSVFLGILIGKLVGFLLLGWGLRKEISLCFDINSFKELIHYTLPLIPSWWLAFGSAYVNRFFVFAQLGANENAILAICMKMAGLVTMFGVSFVTAWQPLAMSYIGEASSNIFYVRSMRIFISGNIFCMFCLLAFIDPVLVIFAPGEYSMVKYYFPLFAVGYVLSGCANNLQLGHQIAKATHWILISNFISIGINISILITLTLRIGLLAVGFGWAVSFAVKDFIMYYTAQKKYYIPYDIKSFYYLGLACGVLLLFGFLNYTQLIPNWLFTNFTALLGVIIAWLAIGPVDRQIIKNFFRNRLIFISR